MSNYTKELMNLSDEDLAEKLGSPLPGSVHHEQIKFEMARRAMIAQMRSAVAAENYTKATWVLICITAIGLGVSLYLGLNS